jgi:FkbM family methyltransferase
MIHSLVAYIKRLMLLVLSMFPNKFVEACLLHLNRSLGRGYISSLDSEVKQLTQFISKLGASNFVFLDIGANIGDYTLWFKSYNPNTPTYSFEPSRNTFLTLEKKLAPISNATALNFAFGEIDGTTSLYSDKTNSGLASLAKRDLDHINISFDLKERVRVRRIDDWSKESDLFDKNLILKIDVEGFELSVLNGAGRLIESSILLVQFEYGGANLDSRTFFKDFWSFFLKYNFVLWCLTPSGAKEVKHYSESLESPINTTYYAVKRHDI